MNKSFIDIHFVNNKINSLKILLNFKLYYGLPAAGSIFPLLYGKNHHSTLEIDFFLISPRKIINLAHDFKSPFLNIEISMESTHYGEV